MKVYIFILVPIFAIAAEFLTPLGSSLTQSCKINSYTPQKWFKNGPDSIYVKITGERMNRKLAEQLSKEFKKQEGVKTVRVNYELATVSIQFDGKLVTSSKLAEIINTFQASKGNQKYRAVIMSDSSL